MKLKSFFISIFLMLQLTAYLPAYADLPPYEPGGVNPLDKKTEFINNHFIALSNVQTEEGVKKFLAVIPSVGSKKIIVYEVNPITNTLHESAILNESVHSPFYATFDPSGLHLFGMSGKKSLATHYAFDPVLKKFVSNDLHIQSLAQSPARVRVDAQSKSKSTGNLFQLDCHEQHFFGFDYSRTLQFFPYGNKAYVTCEDKNGRLEIAGYQFDPKSGTFVQFDTSLSSDNTKGGKSLKNSLSEVVTPSTILIDPKGKYLYVIGDKNTWYLYLLNQNGNIEPTSYSFGTDVAKTVFVTFDPAGKNVYIVARNYGGASMIEQYKFDPSSGALEKVGVVHIPRTDALIKTQARVHAAHIEFTPDGRYAYVLDSKSNLIYQYSVNAESGNLTAQNPATFITCSVIRSLVFDPDPASRFAYAAASDRKTIKWKDKKSCNRLAGNPYELHVDRLVYDPATGQLSNFVAKSGKHK